MADAARVDHGVTPSPAHTARLGLLTPPVQLKKAQIVAGAVPGHTRTGPANSGPDMSGKSIQNPYIRSRKLNCINESWVYTPGGAASEKRHTKRLAPPPPALHESCTKSAGSVMASEWVPE